MSVQPISTSRIDDSRLELISTMMTIESKLYHALHDINFSLRALEEYNSELFKSVSTSLQVALQLVSDVENEVYKFNTKSNLTYEKE